MATVSLKSALKRQFGNTPYGNLSVLSFALATLASGAAAEPAPHAGCATALGKRPARR